MIPIKIKVLGEGGRVTEIEVRAQIVASARQLPYAPDRYFLTTEAAVLLPVDSLIQSRARPSGIANAVKFMRAAYDGEKSRRAPIDVRELGEGRYLVLDGNSTATIAAAAGWPALPCRIIRH
jgi:hypothetical protein